MRNRKITLMTIDYPPQTGGVARYLSELVKASRGAMEVRDVRSNMRQRWPRWWPLVRMIRELRRPQNTQPTMEPLVLVSHVFPVGTAAWIARLLGGPPYVVLFHGLDVRCAKGMWKRWLLRRICARAEGLVCNSDATRRELHARVSDAEAMVLTPGVEDRECMTRESARAVRGIASNQRVVLSVARLIPRKGIDVSIRALASLTQEEGVRYVVVGDGPDRERLERCAAEAGTRVQWIRHASDEEKWQWFAAADVFLLPARDEGNDVEGFGIVFLEAALAGVPAVAGKSGGVSEAVVADETGTLVVPESVADVEHAVRCLLQEDDRRKRLGAQARVRARTQFRWSDRWERLAHAYRASEAAFAATEISIIIPCFNHANDLHRTLEALTQQTIAAKEVIVVDDGSADHPASIVQKYESRLPITLITLPCNQGAPTARNLGARSATAPYLLFLDADAALVPDALGRFVAALDAHPECDFAYASFYWGSRLFRGRPFDAQALRERNYITTSSLIRRAAFPGFDPSLKKFQDWDLWLTMMERGSRGWWINAPLFTITPRKEGISRWLPKIAHAIPWHWLGFSPQEIERYRQAEKIVKEKHHL